MKYPNLALFILIALFSSEVLIAQKSVPPLVQAALLKKIFTFDKALSGKSTIDVTVMGGSEEIVSALKKVGFNAQPGNSVEGDVVYVGSETTAQKSNTAKAGILSVSGVASNAEKGLVSIAFDIEGGKPKIVVNMEQLKAEGHELSADLLMLARIVK